MLDSTRVGLLEKVEQCVDVNRASCLLDYAYLALSCRGSSGILISIEVLFSLRGLASIDLKHLTRLVPDGGSGFFCADRKKVLALAECHNDNYERMRTICYKWWGNHHC